jgi:Arc/MetJ-type ribon-helix-helix transcriptional regulator
MRRTITISVSEEIYALIQEGTRSRFHSTVSEYIRFLVRSDRRPDAVKQEVAAILPPRTANQCVDDARREFEIEIG